jgi:hypothetical protein
MYGHIFKNLITTGEDTCIRPYTDLIVLQGGNANFYILQFHYVIYYFVRTHLQQDKKVRYTLECGKIRGLTQCKVGSWGVPYSNQHGLNMFLGTYEVWPPNG